MSLGPQLFLFAARGNCLVYKFFGFGAVMRRFRKNQDFPEQNLGVVEAARIHSFGGLVPEKFFFAGGLQQFRAAGRFQIRALAQFFRLGLQRAAQLLGFFGERLSRFVILGVSQSVSAVDELPLLLLNRLRRAGNCCCRRGWSSGRRGRRLWNLRICGRI